MYQITSSHPWGANICIASKILKVKKLGSETTDLTNDKNIWKKQKVGYFVDRVNNLILLSMFTMFFIKVYSYLLYIRKSSFTKSTLNHNFEKMYIVTQFWWKSLWSRFHHEFWELKGRKNLPFLEIWSDSILWPQNGDSFTSILSTFTNDFEWITFESLAQTLCDLYLQYLIHVWVLIMNGYLHNLTNHLKFFSLSIQAWHGRHIDKKKIF